MERENEGSFLELIFLVITVIMVPILIICGAFKEPEETKYRIEVVDKYETIGSTWHLIGGRASETEYHLIYKVTPLTEEAKRHMPYGEKVDDEVNYIKYKDTNIGKTYIDNSYPLF